MKIISTNCVEELRTRPVLESFPGVSARLRSGPRIESTWSAQTKLRLGNEAWLQLCPEMHSIVQGSAYIETLNKSPDDAISGCRAVGRKRMSRPTTQLPSSKVSSL
jgi:hypothetical protein